MANGKKSVLLYCDIIHTVKKLTDEQAGKLFKHYLSYINDENPKTDDIIVDLVFEPIKRNLKRDLESWKRKKEGRSKAGKASAEARKSKKNSQQKATNSTSVKFVEQKATNSTVNVNVNDTVKVKVNDIVNDIVKERNKTIPKKQKVFLEEDYNCLEKCLKYFPEQLRPKTEKIKYNWINTISLLNKIDKIPYDKIIEIVKLTREDHFWSKNFMSLTKLRQKKDGLPYIVIFNEKFNNERPRETFAEAYARNKEKFKDLKFS